jgi:hypothetical protein
MLGDIGITNQGRTACYLQGYLHVALLDQQGHPLAVQLLHEGTFGTAGLNGPVVSKRVILSPGKTDSAIIGLRWSNWCGTEPGIGGVVQVSLMLNGKTLAVPHKVNLWGVTTCLSLKQPSLLEEGPVQRSLA